MKRKSAPFYLRRIKEALVTFPDPETGQVNKLFVTRDVQTAAFDLDGDEFTFYDALTDYVIDQSARRPAEDSPAARAMGFTMAMLQRRFASSAYAARRTLERMRDRRQRILEDPEKFRQQQIEKNLPEDFDELPDEDQQKILDRAGERRRQPRPGAAPHRDPGTDGAHRRGTRARRSRGRVQAQQAPRRLDEVGHLRRPEDEAPHLHGAQGHARLPRGRRQGRPPEGQAASSGASRSRRSTAA